MTNTIKNGSYSGRGSNVIVISTEKGLLVLLKTVFNRVNNVKNDVSKKRWINIILIKKLANEKEDPNGA